MANLDEQLSRLQYYCLALTREVSTQYQLISNNAVPNSPSPINQTFLAWNVTQPVSQVNLELDRRLTALESELRTISNAGDKSVVSYGDLGFRTLTEAASWLNDNFVSETGLFGYLLDFHMMMRHISSDSSSGLGTNDVTSSSIQPCDRLIK